MEQGGVILVADGQAGSASLIKMRLDSVGYKTILSSSGKDVFVKVVEMHPDVVILSSALSDMSGQDALEHLQENPASQNIKIIFIADNEEIKNKINFFECSVITKPYDPNELLSVIEKVMQEKEFFPEPEEEEKDIPAPKSTVKQEVEIKKVIGRKTKDSEGGVNLRENIIPPDVIEKIPAKFVWHYRIVPVKFEKNVLTIASATPNDFVVFDDLSQYLGVKVKALEADEASIEDAIKKYYGVGGETVDEIFEGSDEEEMKGTMEVGDSEDIAKMAGDASVVKLVNQILVEAKEKNATDIHIEPYQGSMNLRYRIDGVLVDAKVPQNIVYFFPAIISRIKIMSGLNIVERRLPQDGRTSVNIKNEKYDLRISTVPSVYGESIVIRILPGNMLFSLEKVGFSEDELQIFEELIKRPHGVIFVTGPTGSGKTTTLYAAITKIKSENVGAKIITIEDPVEYQLEGITQVQVNPEIDLTFARGLRSFLRHDPDIMMVGEVRDGETAEIAIRMALTGHLLFSTLHTNDAASGVTRLLDIGVEPYLVSTAINAFVAQRLIRTICPKCKEVVEEDQKVLSEIASIRGEITGVRDRREDDDKKNKTETKRKDSDAGKGLREGEKCYRGRGCESCSMSGYKGRTSIFEILLITESIRELIIKKASSEEIKKVAIDEGMKTLYQHGFEKVVKGVTTFEEILRVVQEEEQV